MSFAVWDQHPPFTFDKGDQEQIYQVGDKFVVTDDPARATQAEVDALRSPKAPQKSQLDALQDALIAKGTISMADLDAAQVTVDKPANALNPAR